MTFDVFLSHNGRDKPMVIEIAERLQARGLRPWLDAWHLTKGGRWQDELFEGLHGSSACAVCIGPHGLGDWSREELDVARSRAAKERSFHLFAVLLPGTPDPFDRTKLPAFLGNRTWIDLRRGIDEAGIEAVAAAIEGRALGPRAPVVGARPRTRSAATRRLNMPSEVTPFVGRKTELRRLIRALEETRLITLVGAGGSGKTRLAIEAATRALESFADGTTFVDLAAIRDPGLVPAAVVAALGAPEVEGGGAAEAAFAFLADRKCLLVLDNLEHVLPASTFISELLARAPWTHVLATSRSSLGIRGEQQVAVEPLPTPPSSVIDPRSVAGYDAVRLFLNGARQRGVEIQVTPVTAPLIGAICRGLDGLPLALELASARTSSMSLSDLHRSLDGRLDLSTTDLDVPSRQRTLRSTIAWSAGLLDSDVRKLFARLGVFVGGFALDAAGAVAGRAAGSAPSGELLSTLDQLVRQSLLVFSSLDETDGRYSMLETIREFALDELASGGEETEARERAADWLIAVVQDVDRAFAEGHDQALVLRRAERERPNVREALAWAAASGHEEAALRLASARNFWVVRGGAAEARVWLVDLLGRSTTYSDRDLAAALTTLGALELRLGMIAEARGRYEAARPIWERLGERRRVAVVENQLNIVAERLDDFDGASEHLDRAFAIMRELDDRVGMAAAAGNRGILARRQGDLDEAEQWNAEALRLARELGDEEKMYTALINLGGIAVQRGELAAAKPLIAEALQLCTKLDDSDGTIILFDLIAELAGAEGQLDDQVALFAGSGRLREESGQPRYPSEIGDVEALLDAAKRTLGLAYDVAVERGRRMSTPELLDLARARLV